MRMSTEKSVCHLRVGLQSVVHKLAEVLALHLTVQGLISELQPQSGCAQTGWGYVSRLCTASKVHMVH